MVKIVNLHAEMGNWKCWISCQHINQLKGSLVFYFNFSFTSWKYNSSWHPMFKYVEGQFPIPQHKFCNWLYKVLVELIQFFKLSTNFSIIFIWYLQWHSRRWNPKSCPLVIVDEDVQQALDVVGRPTDKEGKYNWAWISCFNCWNHRIFPGSEKG